MPLDLGAPAAELTRLAAAVRDDQLADPTPCEDTDVAGILAHLIGLSVAFRDGAAKISGPTTSTPPGPVPLPQDWREQLPVRLADLAAAWRDPSAWEGETTVGGVTMPAPNVAGFANNELVVHGWDLAVATSQAYRPAEANLEASWQLVSHTPDDPQVRSGLFGPVVPVPADAPLLDRTLGAAGRRPDWAPPGP
jgi:uncharacterized protein (TIGR03086 family)